MDKKDKSSTKKTIALVFGLIVGGLGLLGLFMGDGKIMTDSMNIDMMLDIARIALGGLLIYGSLNNNATASLSLFIFGVAYLGMFVMGLISPSLFGLLPSELGSMDQILHAGGGIIAVIAAKMGDKD